MNRIIRWFNPNTSYVDAVHRVGANAHAKNGKKRTPPPSAFIQYAVFSAGVFAAPLLRHFRAEGGWPELTQSLIGFAFFSLLTGFIVFPRVIDSLATDDSNNWARLSTVFTAGVGWEQYSGLPAVLAQ